MTIEIDTEDGLMTVDLVMMRAQISLSIVLGIPENLGILEIGTKVKGEVSTTEVTADLLAGKEVLEAAVSARIG